MSSIARASEIRIPPHCRVGSDVVFFSTCSGTRRCSQACVKFGAPCCRCSAMRKSPSRAMCKGLPTFRAGGIASSFIDYGVRADQSGGGGSGGHKKTALTPTFFSHDHFSSSLADTEDPMLKRTRVTVKLIEGRHLLVSDLSTGTSDPVAHLWVGSVEDGDVDSHQDKHVQSTEVCKHTVDPVWDAEFIFPLEVQTVEDVLSGRLNIRVRDHDDADGDVHYLDLGRVTISLETVLTEGNIMAHTQLVQLPARWYPLQRCPGMRKSQGALKIAVGFFVGADSVLLRGDDGGILDDNAGVATRFEHHMRRIRGYGATTTGSGRAASMSPARRSPTTSRSLTARGGTTNQRPKSAPGATTLTSPNHLRQRPFELKPIQPQFPVQDTTQTRGATHSSELPRRVTTESIEFTRVAEAVASAQRPRWQDTYGSTEKQFLTAASPSRLGSAKVGVLPLEGRRQEDRRTLAKAVASPALTAKHVRSSSKLSRLAAKASQASLLGSPQWGSTGWGQEESAMARAHRWQRRLLECMQRLEARSTEASAYGELRAMVREASSPQVGQVVAAARTVGSACSLAARRYTLRLLAWLCWDQPRAAGKFCGGIVEYALDRIQDEETASLCGDLTLCVGAVMLSALRVSSADASMTQTRRFLRLVGEQRTSVRVAAGACCAATVLPPPFPVPVEMETHVRSIEDVRLAVGKAAGRVGVANAVPKEAVLLPEGRALIELADAEAAAEFYNRISIAAGDLPRNWSVFPFPEDFCAEVKLAEAAHHARLTVNSEEILACLLEALGSGRSEGTRAELFNAVAAMARSCAIYGPSQETSDGLPTIAEFDLGGQPARGLLATLRKGLPAIVQAVSTVLDCPVRRAFSWKERKAALDLIVALAALRDLRGPEGPLGEHRLQLIHGATTGKRDSVAAVREAAVQSLAALEATGVEKTERETLKTGMISCLGTLGDGSRGVGETGMSVDDTRNKHHQSGEAETFTDLEKLKKKTLDGALRKWERVASDAVDAAERKIERFREHRDEGRKKQQRQRRAEEEAPVASSTLSALLEVERTPSSRDGEQQQERPTSPQKISLSAAVADECEEKDVNGNTRTPDRCKPTPLGTPGASEDGAETGKDDTDRAPPEREAGADTSRAEATTTHDAVPKRGHQECDIPPARLGGNATAEVKQECVQGAVPLQRQQPLPTTPSPAEDKAQFSVTSIVPKLDQEEPAAAAVTVAAVAAATGEGPAPMLAPSSLLPPMNGGPQADTARLLQHLCNKTDTIASVLESLGQRVVGMERTLVSQESPHSAESSTFSPPRQLKRPRSVRARSPNTAPFPKGELDHSTPNFVQATAPKASVAAEFSSARSTTRVRRQIALLVRREDFEQAFRLALTSGTERDVLRLMGSAGGPDLCRRRLGMETRDRLFAFLARTISGGLYAEHALPWVFELVRAGEARALTLAVRMQLAGALHGLAASPTDQGVMAAKLGPYLSLTSVGRSSLSDAAAGGGVFSSLEVTGGRA